MTSRKATRPTPEQRFWPKVKKGDVCWLWQARLENGYGSFYDGERQVGAHRFAYELLVGPIPEGLTLDHLCRNKACVNPDHLEPVTNAENVMRGEGISARRARQTHCKHGHAFSPENTYITTTGHRKCRTCFRARRRLRRQRRLSTAMAENLCGLAALGRDANWHPETAGQWRCAEALVRRGLLARNPSRGDRPFELNKAGYELGQQLLARRSP